MYFLNNMVQKNVCPIIYAVIFSSIFSSLSRGRNNMRKMFLKPFLTVPVSFTGSIKYFYQDTRPSRGMWLVLSSSYPWLFCCYQWQDFPMSACALNLLNSFLTEVNYSVIKHHGEFSLTSVRFGFQVRSDLTDFTEASRRGKRQSAKLKAISHVNLTRLYSPALKSLLLLPGAKKS